MRLKQFRELRRESVPGRRVVSVRVVLRRQYRQIAEAKADIRSLISESVAKDSHPPPRLLGARNCRPRWSIAGDGRRGCFGAARLAILPVLPNPFASDAKGGLPSSEFGGFCRLC